MRSHDTRRCRMALLTTSTLLLSFSPAVAKVPRGPAACSAMKVHAEGRGLSATLGCHARAKRRGLDVDPACLAPASTALEAAFTHAGTLCNGNMKHATTLLTEWTNTLIDDIA